MSNIIDTVIKYSMLSLKKKLMWYHNIKIEVLLHIWKGMNNNVNIYEKYNQY